MSKYLLIVLIFLAGVTLAGGIYKWIDEQGRTIYSGTPPSGKITQELVLPPQPPKEELQRARQKLRNLQKQEVIGTIAIGFMPTALATVPKPPINFAVVIKSFKDGANLKFNIADRSPQWEMKKNKYGVSHQNFSFSLRPGSYEIIALELEAGSLSISDFSLVTGGPRFTVPEGNCVYIGRIALMYMRLPPGSHGQAVSFLRTMAKRQERGSLMLYLTKGSLISASHAIDIPVQKSHASGYRAFTQAREKRCTTQLAMF